MPFPLAVSLLAAVTATAPPAAAPPVASVRVDARTTDGKSVSYPGDARGRPLVLVVGLAQNAAKPSADWCAALQRRVGDRATVVGVAVLDKVPRFARGFVERAIDKQVGAPRAGEAGFVTTADGGTLRRLAPPGDDGLPVLYVFRADGSLANVERSAYTEGSETALVRAIP